MTKHTNSYKNNNIASSLTGCTVVFNNSARSMLVLISPFPVGSPAHTRTHRRGFGVILFNEKEEQIKQTLSPPQRPLCVVRGLGRGKNTVLSKHNTMSSKHNKVLSKHNTMSSKYNTVLSKHNTIYRNTT